MSSFYINDTLDRCLRDILEVIKPSHADVMTRYQVINEFKAVVESVESLRGATVEPFGSFVSNLYTRWGDLDISIELQSGSLVSSAGKKIKQKFLRDIWRALRRRGGVHNLEFIPKARVPLLIFVSNRQSIHCDISISNLLGQIKSKFLLWITEIDERFRDMVLLIKEWAKSQHINDPKTGTLNSYSLCLLVIFHFQTCEPAILPPLHEIYAGNIAHDLTGSRVTAERNIQETCTANIERYKRNIFGNDNKSSLTELFISFFHKFSRINTMASEHAICTYTGRWEHKGSNPNWTKAYPLHIEDPFEQQENTSRAVSMSQLVKISEAFSGTYFKLVSPNRDRSSLIYSLVRSHIGSQINTRTPNGRPISLNGGGAIHPPEQSRAVHPIDQVRLDQVRRMSPIDHVRRISPVHQVRRMNPVDQVRRISPVDQVRRKSPVDQVHGMSPIDQVRHMSPIDHVRRVNPVDQVRHMNPVDQVRRISPVDQVRRISPVDQVRRKSPVDEGHGMSPIDQVRHMRYETNPSPSVPLRRPEPTAEVQGQRVWKPKFSDR